jgi:thiol-disulfide isomerase/thioredoxin
VENKPPEVKLEVVKHIQLLDALKAQRGKVVVLDVWASWCVPCKQEFPHLVELHQRYAKDGVVCVSVSLDEPKQRDTALTFLKSKGAAFPNYLLDEGDGGWDKLDVKSIPAVFVYDREGKLARKFTGDDPDNQFTYADVEKFVQELIAPTRNRKGE